MRFLLLAALPLLMTVTTLAQAPPKLTKHHKRIAEDVGKWTGTMKVKMPGAADEVEMPIVEENSLIDGGMWLISAFESGPFKGQGQFGYDTNKKKYVGTWVDNQSSHLNIMEGEYDEKSGELVMTFEGRDEMSGQLVDMKSVTTRPSDDKRLFVMYAKREGEWSKMFEIHYSKAE